MTKTIEGLTNAIRKNNKIIEELLRENSNYALELENLKDEEKDFISLTNASRKFNLSYATLYKKVQTGDLKNYSKTSVIMVKQSDVERVMFKKVGC